MDRKSFEFAVADLNGRFDQLLKRSDYSALAHCKSFEELIIKLNHHFPHINEDMEYSAVALRAKLYRNVLDELEEFQDRECDFIDYFLDYNKITAFFTTLETGRAQLVPGAVEELRGLASCKSLDEAIRLYVQDTELARYFSGIDANGAGHKHLQKTMALVLKNYYDFYYSKASSEYFREIIEAEGSRQILEICLNGSAIENKTVYFPLGSTVSESDKSRLRDCIDPREIRELVCPLAQEPIAHAIEMCMQVYANSFKQYGDLSCLYAYFRLKEQEMNNIVWISECILQNSRSNINDIILFE